MRIVIDGAPGSGKSTFLGTKYASELRKYGIPTVFEKGYTVFSELMRGSLDEGINIGIVPPKNINHWNQLFQLIFEKARDQYNSGAGNNIFWYDRGLPYLYVLGQSFDIYPDETVMKSMHDFNYDYVFVFRVIESYDLSKNAPGKLSLLTLDDRYNRHQKTMDIYKKLGHTVYEVPVFSDDLKVNFEKRFEYISNIVGNM